MAFSRKRMFSKKRVARKGLKRRVYRKSKLSLRRYVRTQVTNMAESKIKDSNVANTQLYHNVISYSIVNSNVAMPSQGAGGTNRVGDEIFLKGYMLRFMIGQKADRPNLTTRIIIGYVNRGFIYNYNLWFRVITGNKVIDPVNPDVIKVMKDVRYRPNQGSLASTGGREFTYARSLWIPAKKRVKFPPYLTDADDDNLYCFILQYDSQGTLETDNVGFYSYGCSVHFKDI